MANVIQIQKKINFGYGKVAKITGDVYSWYRPDIALAPIAAESFLGLVTAQFATDSGFQFYKPSDFATADRWFGTFNTQQDILPGDYFVGLSGTYYAVIVERFVAIQCTWCNRTVSVGRAQDVLAAGASTEYSGQSVNNLVPVLVGWPASLRQLGSGMKMRGTDMKLPTDAPLGAYQLLLPALAGANLQWNDVISDDLGRRYTISTLELTQMGWRISAEMWPT